MQNRRSDHAAPVLRFELHTRHREWVTRVTYSLPDTVVCQLKRQYVRLVSQIPGFAGRQ
jgi:uncharacterized protein (DUF1499 family)